jgi:3-hydroxyacyl-CoA dehydrogenase/chromosome segregation ATPase
VSLSDAAEAAFVEGLKAVEDGKIPSALEKFTRACALYPLEPRYQGYRAWTQYHNPSTKAPKEERHALQKDSCRKLQSAVDQCPDYDPLHVLLGTIHMAEQRPKEAARAFQKALAINPDNNGALLGLKAAKKRSPAHTELAVSNFVPQTLPSPSLSSITSNRIAPLSPAKPSHFRTEQYRTGNVFSNARLRAQIDGLKRARSSERSGFEEHAHKQSQTLDTLRQEHEENVQELRHQIADLTQDKKTLSDEFTAAREMLASEKQRFAGLAQEQARAAATLGETHDEIKSKILQAKAEAQVNQAEHSAQTEELSHARTQLTGELGLSQRKVQELEDSLGAEKQVLEVSHQSIADLSREYEQTKTLYQQEIETRQEEHEHELQKSHREQNRLRKQIEELHHDKQSDAQHQHEKQLQIQKLEHKTTEIDRALSQRTELLTQTEKELKERVVALDRQRSENETKRLELEKNSQDQTRLESEMEVLQRHLREQQDKIDQLDMNLDDANTSISRAQNELGASQAEVALLRKQKKTEEDRQSWIQKAESKIERREHELTALNEVLEKANDEVTRLQNQNKQQNRDHDALLLKIEELTTQAALKPRPEELEELKRKSTRSRFDLDQARKQTEQAQKKLDELEHHKTQQQDQVQSLRAESDEYRNKLRQIESEHVKDGIEKEGLLNRIEDLKTEASLRPTKNEIDKLRRDLDETRRTLAEERARTEDQEHLTQKQQAEHDIQISELRKKHASNSQSLAEDSAKKIQSLRDDNSAKKVALAEITEENEKITAQDQANRSENESLLIRVDELQNQVSHLPSKNEVEFLRGQFEKSQNDLDDARERIEEERIRIEELERLNLEEHQKSIATQRKAAQDQLVVDQAKAQRNLLEDKYAKTAGTLSTVLQSIQTQLTAEKERSEKVQQHNTTTITHLSTEKDNLVIELRDAKEELLATQNQLQHIEKGYAHNRKELEKELSGHVAKADALHDQINQNEQANLSKIEEIKKGLAKEIEVLEQEIQEKELSEQSHIKIQKALEQKIEVQEEELTAKLDKQALLVLDIKDDSNRNKTFLENQISVLHESLETANDELSAKELRIAEILQEQQELALESADATRQLRQQKEQSSAASHANRETLRKLDYLENIRHADDALIEALRKEAAESSRSLANKIESEEAFKRQLEEKLTRVETLESELQSNREELSVLQNHQSSQKEDLTRQLKIAYTEVERLEIQKDQLEAEKEYEKQSLRKELTEQHFSLIQQARQENDDRHQAVVERKEQTQSMLQTAELRLKDLHDENEQLRQSVIIQSEDLTANLDKTENERDALRHENNDLQNEMQRADARHDSIIRDANEQLRSKEVSLEETAVHIERLRNEFALKEIETEEAQDEMELKIQQLSQDLENTRNKNEQLTAQLARDESGEERANSLSHQQVELVQNQLEDTRAELQQVKTENAESKKEMAKSKIETSSQNERLKLELRRLRQEAEEHVRESKSARDALEDAQERLNEADIRHNSVFQRAHDDVETARANLNAIEASAASKQSQLLGQLKEAQRQLLELRELEEFSRSRLVQQEKDVDELIRSRANLEKENQEFSEKLASLSADEPLRDELALVRNRLNEEAKQYSIAATSLKNDLSELKRELADSEQARADAEEMFKSQFQRLELDFQSRVGELKSHFEEQLQISNLDGSGTGLSGLPSASPRQLSHSNRLDVPDLAEESAVEVPIYFTSDPATRAGTLDAMNDLDASRTVPAPGLMGKQDISALPKLSEFDSMAAPAKGSKSAQASATPKPGVVKQNFASIEELLSALDLPFPELDESSTPQELPDESLLEQEIAQEGLLLDTGTHALSEPIVNRSTQTVSESTSQAPRGFRRIKTFLSKFGGAEMAEGAPPNSKLPASTRSDRHHVRFQMSFDNGSDYHLARVQDISETGIYLETAEAQPIGTELTLSPVGIKEFEELEFKAVVVRSKPYSRHGFGDEPPGMGLRFVPMKDKIRKRLLFLIRQLEDQDIRDSGILDPYLGVRIHERNHAEGEEQDKLTVRVVGGGIQAGEISYLLVNHGIPIHLSSVEEQPIDVALEQASNRFSTDVQRGQLKNAEAAQRLRLMATTDKNIDVSKIELVIESVADPLSIKKAVIRKLEKTSPRHATIITVVSEGNMVNAIADGLRHPERLCGLHFISGTENAGMVEIVRGKLTADSAVQEAVKLVRKTDLKPIVISDDYGLLIHRILGFYFNEAGHLIENGVSFEAIDEVAKGFGFTKGPLQLMDEYGISFVRKNADVLESAFGERAKVPSSLLSIANSGRKGREAGRGFYQYVDGQSRGIDPGAYLDCGSSAPGSHDALAEDEIRSRLLLTMINEAARAIGDNIIDSPGVLDMALVMSCGFPAFRKGLLHYGDALRPTVVLNQLEDLEDKYGSRFTPALYLRMLAENDELFYQAK